ncbi:MAG: DUF1080 domain-containing protein [Ginsengibacter sp.]
MKNIFSRTLINARRLCCLLMVLLSCNNKMVAQEKTGKDGFVKIFDGKALDGWEGDSTYWSVEDGKIVGVITPATIIKRNTFLIWQGGVAADFELKVEYKISEGGNSGINYRSELVDDIPHALRGYQCDIDAANQYTGQNYEERRRCIIAFRGQKVTLPNVTEPLRSNIKDNVWTASIVTASLGNVDSLKQDINEGWNEVHIIAKGNRLQHFINGLLMSDVTDDDTVNRRLSGLLGVQVHVGPPMKVEYRNFRLKKLK